METILITGGAGFIGTNVTQQLVERPDVERVILMDNLSAQIHGDLPVLDHPILNHPKVRLVRGDIAQRDALVPFLNEATALIHFAAETGTAQSMYQIAHYNAVNSQGTALMMQTLTDHPHRIRRMVLASSRSVYGEGAYVCPSCHTRQYPEPRTMAQLQAHQWDHTCSECGSPLQAVPTREDDRIKPASIYAATKYAQEDLIRIAGQALGIQTAILRFQNVYGEGQSLNNPYTGILSILSTKVRQGSELPVYEDGAESRDFVHVEDVARAVVLALTDARSDGQVFNVGAGEPTSILDMVRLLARQLGDAREPVVTAQFRVGDIRHCYADMTLIREKLGFVPQVTLEEGLRRFADWVLTQPLPEDKLEQANAELRKHKLMV